METVIVMLVKIASTVRIAILVEAPAEFVLHHPLRAKKRR